MNTETTYRPWWARILGIFFDVPPKKWYARVSAENNELDSEDAYADTETEAIINATMKFTKKYSTT